MGLALTREADENTVKDAFSHARRALTPKVANAYLAELYGRTEPDEEGFADLTPLQAQVAALTRVLRDGEPVIVKDVEDLAEEQTKAWLDDQRGAIAFLGEARRAVYEEIRGMARDPEIVSIELPKSLRVEGMQLRDDIGTTVKEKLSTVAKHLLSDANGDMPRDPAWNTPEQRVIDKETVRPTLVAWYRNPSSASKHALRVPYRAGGGWKSMQPDFVFIDRNTDGELVASIVDPHGAYLSDALPKLVGLADYAAQHGDRFARIESLDNDDEGTLRVLDMKNPAVRQAVRDAVSAKDLFDAPWAGRY